MTNVPKIVTERLVMRGFEQRDFAEYKAMMSNPNVTQFLGDTKPLSATDAWRQMAIFAGHWTLRGFGVWALEERATGKFIGRAGCFEPEGWPGFEIGYVLAQPAWGNGYATEAAATALAYARNELRRTEIISIIRPLNYGSIRVATGLGATRADGIDFFGGPADIYRYP